MGESSRKWITHYGSSHDILLVGEGNFSFSACLASAFGTATNVVATSLDSEETLLRKYGSDIKTTLEELKELGCSVMHGVDVTTMSQHPLLCHTLFDRIVFNFPHAGFQYSEHETRQIKLHQNLVRRFLRNAKELLAENGDIHITHKISFPYSEWEIEEVAEEEDLFLRELVEFNIGDYPGYVNKKGSGPNSNLTFPVGLCSTFKFVKTLSKKMREKRLAKAAEFSQLMFHLSV